MRPLWPLRVYVNPQHPRAAHRINNTRIPSNITGHSSSSSGSSSSASRPIRNTARRTASANRTMDVIERAASMLPRPEAADDAVTILSWNVLAGCYSTNEDGTPQRGKHLDHVPVADIAWAARCAKILAEITTAHSDVICLQEVEPRAFEAEFLPALAAQGYDGVIQKNDHVVGVATFWRREKLSCTTNCNIIANC